MNSDRDSAEVRSLAQKEFDYAVKEIQADINDFANSIKTAVAKACIIAEKLSSPEMRGADKKKFVLEILNDYIDIPYIPDFFEGKLILKLIDNIVDTANKYKWNIAAKEIAELTEDEDYD